MSQPCSTCERARLIRLITFASCLACLALPASGQGYWYNGQYYYYQPDYPPWPSDPSAPSPPKSPASGKKKKSNAGAIAGGVIGAVAAIALIVAVIMLYRRRQRRLRAERASASPLPNCSAFATAAVTAAGVKTGTTAGIYSGNDGKGDCILPPPGALNLPPPGSVMAVALPTIQTPSMVNPAAAKGSVTSDSQVLVVTDTATTTTTTMRTATHATMSSGSVQPPPHVTVHMQPMGSAVSSAVSGAPFSAAAYGARPVEHTPDTSAVVSARAGDVQATQHTAGSGTGGTHRSVTASMASAALESLRIQWSEIQMSGELGKGGFAVVYKGLWAGNRVAVKVLNRERASASVLSSLHQEAIIMSELRHPCLVRVFGLVDEPPHHALVMQYYRKGTLSRFMGTPAYAWVDVAARLRLAIQVASGMKHLHARNILHSDLKTSNILLDDEGNAVIADFGLASLQEDQQAEVAQSGAHTVSISPPEVLVDPRIPRTQAGDVYAFAIVLLEIMAGKPAYTGLKAADINYLVASGRRPAITSDVPLVVGQLIADCWFPEPSVRPSFAAILERLTAAAQHLAPSLDETTITHTTGVY